MARPRQFDYARVRKLRKDGLSYAAIARKMDMTESAVYYIVNPERRQVSRTLGLKRVVYMKDGVVEMLDIMARREGVSRSRYIDLVLHGEAPVLLRIDTSEDSG